MDSNINSTISDTGCNKKKYKFQFWKTNGKKNRKICGQSTSQGRSWVEERIRKMISSEYEVIEHITQIRPTVMDRRPLIGTHPDHQNIHLLNGFGARGVLGAPMLSKWLLDHIEGISELPTAVNLSRFESYFRQSD